MAALEKRKNQVFSETIKGLPVKKGPFVSLFSVQNHKAKKRGQHYDYRLVVGNRAISFFDPKGHTSGLPKQPGERKRLLRGPDHKAEYALFKGEIPEGEYGAGKVELVDVQPAVVKIPDKKSIDLRIYRGPFEGKYKLYNIRGKKYWEIYRRPGLEGYHTERMPFSSDIPESVWTDPRYIAEEKLNGAFYYGILGPKGISFVSRRLSTKGGVIHREENVPHLRDLKVPPKYYGTVIAGEMNHDKGFHFLSGMLNSTPDKAVEVQDRFGFAKYAPFELVKLPGKDTKLIPYEKRRQILQDIVNSLGSPFVRLPDSTIHNKKKFYNKVIKKGGEGIVIKNLDQGYKEGVWYRKKKIDDYDARIVGFEEGSGKYKGKGIGIMWVEGKDGKRFRVGTGFTDAMRQDMYKHPKRYIGKLVKIKKQSITAPVFSLAGFTTDKNEPDLIPAYKGDAFKESLLGAGVPPDEINRVKYSILSKTRWRKKSAARHKKYHKKNIMLTEFAVLPKSTIQRGVLAAVRRLLLRILE